MPLLLPLNEQTPETASDFVFFFPVYLSADALMQTIDPSYLSSDVAVQGDSAALISADVEGAEGGSLILIDLVQSRLR